MKSLEKQRSVFVSKLIIICLLILIKTFSFTNFIPQSDLKNYNIKHESHQRKALTNTFIKVLKENEERFDFYLFKIIFPKNFFFVFSSDGMKRIKKVREK